MSARRPDYRAKALNKVNGVKGEVGAAWTNPDGSISLILDNFVTLTQDGHLLVTLFPADKEKEEKK